VSEALGILTGFTEAAVRVATPLALAALGETVAERSGVINLGIEGSMLAGALASAIVATAGGPVEGLVAAAGAGLLLALLFAAVAVGARGDQIITGTAVTLLATGVTGTVYRRVFGNAGVSLTMPTLGPIRVPLLADVPVVGAAFFDQPVTTYLVYGLVPLLWVLLYRTRWGLGLRAAGESIEAARAQGVAVERSRVVAVGIGGALAGLGGGALVLAQVGTFAEQMTAGRGFIAIAIVVLGAWHPVRVAVAALLFGAASALQFLFQSLGVPVPYQLFLMLPYLLALAALAGRIGRVRSPAALGK
jgi:general nucleoside transport system permease protein